MSQESMIERISDLLQMPAGEAREAFPIILDQISDYGVEKSLEEVPDLLAKLIGKLVEINAAELLTEKPEVSDRFMNILGQGVGILALKSREFGAGLRNTRELKVNLETSDSPLRGYFTTSGGKLSGGAGLLPFKDQDFRYLGPTEVLLGLIRDELTLSTTLRQLLTEGHPGFPQPVSRVMKGIARLIKGQGL